MNRRKPKELTLEEFRNQEPGIVWMDIETGKLIFPDPHKNWMNRLWKTVTHVNGGKVMTE